MANFKKAISIVLNHEGGYQNDEDDSGNYNSRKQLIGTNYGISAPVLETYLGRAPSVKDMKQLSVSTAKVIYRVMFWNKMKGNSFSSQQLANIVLDHFVNAGGVAVKMLQRVVKVEDDGIVGPVTLKAVNSSNPNKVHDKFKRLRVSHYRKLVQLNPSRMKYLKGWLNRVASFPDLSNKQNGILLVTATITTLLFIANKLEND